MKNLRIFILLFILNIFFGSIIYGQNRSGTFSWRMVERFGNKDENIKGMTDLYNTSKYANPSSFPVILEFDHTPPSPQELGVNCCVQKYLTTKWYINDQLKHTILPEQYGFHPWKLRVGLQEEVTYVIRTEFIYQSSTKTFKYISEEEAVRPDDILIVALGDSYGSGEGNPDNTNLNSNPPGVWWADAVKNDMTGADNGNSPHTVFVDHNIAHRSTTVWSAQAAVDLEKKDPHSSVTYVNLASGGGETNHLINTNQVKNWGTIPYIQINEADRIVGNRSIDHLVISTGGNDVGFKEILVGYLFRKTLSVPFPVTFKQIEISVNTGNWTAFANIAIPDFLIGTIDFTNNQGLNKLPSLYDDLNQKIKNTLPNTKEVYLLQYPDISAGCISVMYKEDKGLKFMIDSDEIAHAKKYVIDPLNDLIRKKSKEHDWTAISPGDWNNTNPNSSARGYCWNRPNIASSYKGYGYHYSHSNPPNPFRSNLSWILNYNESESYQKDVLGVAHPNVFGHRALALSFLDQMMPQYQLICKKDRYVFARNRILSSINCSFILDKNVEHIWKAGHEIILDPGFDSQIGTDFEALIDPKLRN